MKSSIVLILAAICLPVSAAITPLRLGGSSIVMSATGAESATLVWYVKEAVYADRDTTLGTVFWKRDTVRASSEGTFTIDVDLAKAKDGVKYCVIVVNHTDGKKFKLCGTVSNGGFVSGG